MFDLPAVILAGGLSRRMGGGDKSLLMLGGRPILSYVIDRIGAQAAPVYLNANGDPERFGAFGLEVLPDPLPGHPGPLAGVLAGLDRAARDGADWVVSVAADTPFFPPDLVERLSDAIERDREPIALAATGTRHPTFGLWPVSFREDLRDALETGTRRVTDWADRHGAATAQFAEDGFDPFFNINTADDMLLAEEILRGEI